MAGTDDMWGLADYGPLAELLAPAGRSLVDAVASRPGERLLDVAAGFGHASELAAERGAVVTAVDGSPAMVAAGRARTDGSVQWLDGQLTALPVADGSADVVVSSFGVIFSPSPVDTAAELHRVLAPGGRLAVSVWPDDGLMADMGRAMARFMPYDDPVDRAVWADPSRVTRLLTEAGLERVEVSPAGLPWRFPGPAAMSEFLRRHSPAHVASAHAAGARADAMFAAVESVFAPDGGPVDRTVEYLTVTARRPVP